MLANLYTIVARIRGFLRPDDLDRDFKEELEAHLALAEEDKMRQGMTRQQARRAARLDLGGVTQLREAGWEARGLPGLDTFRLDIKLGLRMLRKSWGMTLIGGLAMTLAIAIGLIVFTALDWAYGGRLPLDEGDRVVALQSWDEKAQRLQGTSFDDFERWRGALRSVEDLGAFRTVEGNLILGDGSAAASATDGPAESVFLAEMTASGFQLARVPALLGRTLLQEDELAAATPVVVIGYDVWQSRFSADPAVVGRAVRFGDTVHTVVGVMPEGFEFPINHRFWTPLREDRWGTLSANQEAAIFGRLAAGVTLEGAGSELTTLGLLPSVGPSGTDREIHLRIEPYTFAFSGGSDRGQTLWFVRLALVLVTLLLVPPCANIAILVYARTILRQEEFAARYALGASRGRIVGQLFVEMLVLAAGSAAAALVIVGFALRWAELNLIADPSVGAPFWMDFSLSFGTVLFAAALAVVAALIAGLVPALKATGRQMQSGLHTLGSRTGMKLGATWTTLVVAQVAISLAALPAAVEIGWGTVRKGVLGPGFAAEEYLTARLAMDQELPIHSATANPGTPPGDTEAALAPVVSRFAAIQAELVRELRAEPGILGVTLAELPGDEPWKRIEVEGIPPLGEVPEEDVLPARSLVRANSIDDAFFEVFDIALLTGRGFDAGDFDPGRTPVIANRAFVEKLLGAGNPLGRRLRYVPRRGGEMPAELEPTTWYEVVGVVEDRPLGETHGTLYHPRIPGPMESATLALRVAGDPASLADSLRRIATSLDPTLRVDQVVALDEIYREKAVGNNAGAFSLGAVTLSVLLLSAAGMYALLSFTVNQQRREIGIRSALGAQPRRLLGSIFKRVLLQFSAGTAIGILVALLLDYWLPAEKVGGWSVPGVIPAATALMIVVALLAAAGPARRGLRVDPIEELRNG